MADHIPRSVPPRGIMGLRKSLLLSLVAAVLLVALGLAWVVHRLTASKTKGPALPPAPLYTTAGGGRKSILADEPRTYDAIPKPKPPPSLPPRGIPLGTVEAAVPSKIDLPRPDPRIAAVQPIPVPPGPSPAETEARIRAAIAEAKAQMLQEQNRALEQQLAQQRALQATPLVQGQAPPGQAGQGQGAQPKRPGRWFDQMGEGKSFNIMRQQKADKEGKQEPDGQDLVPRAKWAKPLHVDKVLYWDQPIIGILQTAINSDTPGEVRIKVLRDVLDRELRGIVIIPALTSIRGKQDGSVKFGQQRLNITVDAMIFPDGTVVTFPQSRLADPSGAGGLPAEVDNHYGKLLLGLLFSVGFNIGTRVAAGQPTGEQYTIQQEIAREAGQGVNREAQRIADQFRVPPTLIAAAGDEVSLYASQNINFSHLPVTVR